MVSKTDTKIYKLLLLGNSGVGKTCLLLRYCDNIYNESHVATIGIDYLIKQVQYKNKSIKLQIWDTAGQDRFRSITQSYFKGSQGVMLVYDVTSMDSFNSVKHWVTQIKENVKDNDIVILLLGNKLDSDNREVESNLAEEFADENNLLFMEASAKDNINVAKAFEKLYINIYDSGIVGRETIKKVMIKEELQAESSASSSCCK